MTLRRGKPSFRPNLNEHLNPSRAKHPILNPLDPEELDPATAAAIVSELRASKDTNLIRNRALSTPVSQDNDQNTNDLLCVMSSRLRSLEEQLCQQKELVRKKDQELKELREVIKTVDKNEVDRIYEENAVLRIQNTKLTKELLEFKMLLKDQVQPSQADELEALSSRVSPHYTPRFSLCNDDSPFDYKAIEPSVSPKVESAAVNDTPTVPFNLKKLLKNVAELNMDCGPRFDIGRTPAGQNIHKLVERKPINIILYADGLCLSDGPFRPYTWPAGQAVIQDLLDGYFPYEFKQQHPDGVPMNIVDKTLQVCPKPTKEEKPKVESLDTIADHGYKVISKNTFLNRLPKTIVRNGKIVEVRNDIEQLFKEGTKDSVENISAAPIPQLGPLPSDMSTIQVKCTISKSSTEMKILLVHIYYHQTILDLRDYVKQQLQSNGPVVDDFDLCTVFPYIKLTDNQITIKDANLVPSATLHLKWK